MGEPIRFGLRVGENFRGEPVPRNPEKLDRFLIAGPGGVQPIAGRDGEDPAGVTRVDQPGIYIVGYRSKRSSIELDAEKFEAYLKEEGLARISKLRAARGETAKPGREVYSRAAKALLGVGTSASDGFDTALGFSFEIIPLRNPMSLGPQSDELTLSLVLEGKPAAGIEVFAIRQANPDDKRSGVSNSEGRVSFRISQPGVWMVKAIHMAPAPQGVDADWESIWATLTFQLGSDP